MPKPELLIRWSAWRAQTEFQVNANKIKTGLKLNGVKPGPDGKFSTYQVAHAIFGFNGLEKRAKEAKFRRVIDEAETAKLERDAIRGRLAPVQTMKEALADILTQTVQYIRHSNLTDVDKKFLVRNITEFQYEPTKVVPFKE
jgi:hypothetical protein